MEKKVWIDALIDYTLSEGKMPDSVYRLCKHAAMSETDFYQQFGTIRQLNSEVLSWYFQIAADAVKNSEEWASFSAREKTLALLFAASAQWMNIRSFLLFTKKESLIQLRAIKPAFYSTAREIVASGIQSGEIAPRILTGERYADILWLQFCGIYTFWLNDNSKGLEQTDAAIEKAVHFCYDAFERNFLDSFADLGKFVFQNVWNKKS